MHLSEVWEGNGLGPVLLRTALTPLSWGYALGWNAYQALYTLGLKKPARAHKPVVCVGNLTVGGTGKTPVTLHIAEVLESLSREVVIGCSGYGSPASEGAKIAPTGPLPAAEWGDEPAMFRWLAPSFQLVVGRDRVMAARLVHERFPDAVLLMDDGFQHLPLQKDLTILLDPASFNRRCLPAGPYREPWGHRKNADLVLPGEFRVTSRQLDPVDPQGRPTPVQEANVLCAIGSPRLFVEAIRASGVRVAAEKLLPDHDDLSQGNLFEGLDPDLPTIVTAKDWIKLKDLPVTRQILIARQEVRIEPQNEFRIGLQQKLHEIESKKA